ncbi:aspartate ammonia-lyase [Rhodococcus sp. IEGM 1381]|uniref:aspartate ammonia-lyase n=1 Tax=Rhodococcus sp. IEGM 1381 TaxID=3047085 RepID=UPI0024B66E95|nr:aspartate ammonia-lyase [Rhodococcus sp. IEGM 1381]MDI9893168.1 aspartate ammonia-lyase [Rhodococcus sp. IEGM 1381]
MSRVEHDLLGDRDVADDVLYGVHTVRAIENFPITGIPISVHPELIHALAAVKQAAARANHELALMPDDIARAIDSACTEIRDGKFHDHFVVDVLQGGAGTSTNMNANEVIANRALELLDLPRGRYDRLSPIDHVNLGQSTNDVYPTAIKVGLQAAMAGLRGGLTELVESLAVKSDEFSTVLKVGRTQLQDAVPMTLGQEFGAWSSMLGEDIDRLAESALLISEINLGGTAIGTGLNAHPMYAEAVTAHLRQITGFDVVTASNLVEATQDVGVFVQLSGVLKRTAVKMSKICNDLRLLSSGPRAGFGEIKLPSVQAGSSIMPGKVNPVIPEMVNQVAFRVIGNDLTVTMAAEGGQLQLNAFEPVIAHCLFESIELLDRACRVLASKCIDGIEADVDRMRAMVEASIGVVTALNPYIGYRAATDIAAQALASGKTVTELVLANDLLTEEQLTAVLSPANLVHGIPPLPATATS